MPLKTSSLDGRIGKVNTPDLMKRPQAVYARCCGSSLR